MAANKFMVATETLGSKESAKQHYKYLYLYKIIAEPYHTHVAAANQM